MSLKKMWKKSKGSVNKIGNKSTTRSKMSATTRSKMRRIKSISLRKPLAVVIELNNPKE